MSQAPPVKRQRVEEPKDKDQTPPVQSAYWFDDGNVILQAENTQFRLHRSLLSRHSNVFKDMFSLPQPANDPGLTFEGCPVIFLSDKVTDLECVISVIYDSIRVHDMREVMSIDYLGSIIRLGKKYDIHYLCEEGLKRLRLEFPATLRKWRTCHGEYRHIKTGHNDINLESVVLGLGHELCIPRCLPSAYLLFAATNTLEHILEQSIDNGGTLDREIVMKCVRGRDKFIHECHSILDSWVSDDLFLPSRGCSSESLCASNKVRVIRTLPLFRTLDNFHCTLIPWDEEPDDAGLCILCHADIKAEYESDCEDLWSQLPTFFGLQPWDQLQDFDM